MPTIDLDLDALTGPSLTVKLHGDTLTIWPDFTGADEAQFEHIQRRMNANSERAGQFLPAYWAHMRALKEARDRHEAPPLPPPELEQFGDAHPDVYPRDDWAADVFTLIGRVWLRSEANKPPEERLPITTEYVRNHMSPEQAWGLLKELFPYRHLPRVSVPSNGPDEPPAPETPSKASGRRGRRGARS